MRDTETCTVSTAVIGSIHGYLVGFERFTPEEVRRLSFDDALTEFIDLFEELMDNFAIAVRDLNYLRRTQAPTTTPTPEER